MFKQCYLILCLSFSSNIWSIQFDWEIDEKTVIGKTLFDEVVDLNGSSCKEMLCFLREDQDHRILSGVRFSIDNISLLSELTGIDEISELNKILESKGSKFLRVDANDNSCTKYVRRKKHTGALSYGLSVKEFKKLHSGYMEDIGWVFDENQIVQICDDEITIKRFLTF